MARTTAERVADAKAALAAGGSDAWLTTAHDSVPHLVPLSLAWLEERGAILFCTERSSRTVKNLEHGEGRVRVACGNSRDVVMVDGSATILGLVENRPDENRSFAAQTGWDPSSEPQVWVYLEIVPERVQAWRNVAEIAGRTVMRDGRWVE